MVSNNARLCHAPRRGSALRARQERSGTANQGLLSDADVTTTMINTHVLNQGWGAVRSPADRLLAPLTPTEIGQRAPVGMVLDCRALQSSIATLEGDESFQSLQRGHLTAAFPSIAGPD